MNSGPTLALGATGNDVRRLQRLFVEMKLLDFHGIDGDFGPITDQVVRDFQGSEGLAVDGIVGPATWGALPADPDTPLLANGSNGAEVAALQEALTAYSNEDPATNPGAIDGSFGPMTEAAVCAYQGDRGVPVDGIVGDLTWWVPAGAAGATLASLAGLTTV
jgi:peptidoglycan hydrolase-like protein with peptidoglycan-binding domain